MAATRFLLVLLLFAVGCSHRAPVVKVPVPAPSAPMVAPETPLLSPNGAPDIGFPQSYEISMEK